MSVHHVIAFIRALKVLMRVDSCCFKSKFYRKDLIDELKIFGMSSRHHIDDFMRGRIIEKIEEGRKITDVAREPICDPSLEIVQQYIHCWTIAKDGSQIAMYHNIKLDMRPSRIKYSSHTV
ncbi:hypothetical protein TNCV_2684311 [Trichonephila clavipes]|nr:hypothetical protein TNCV_2684311 [Trichonephila clavipes]